MNKYQGATAPRQGATSKTVAYGTITFDLWGREDVSIWAKVVFISLQKSAWRTRRCTQSNETISKTCGSLSVRTIQRGLKELAALGYVRIEKDRSCATRRAIVLLWMDDPNLNPQADAQSSARVDQGHALPPANRLRTVDAPPCPTDTAPCPEVIAPCPEGTQCISSVPESNSKTSSSSREAGTDDDGSTSSLEFSKILETAEACYGADVARGVGGHRKGIEREFKGDDLRYYEAAIRKAKASGRGKKVLDNPHGYFLITARGMRQDGEIPPEAAPAKPKTTPTEAPKDESEVKAEEAQRQAAAAKAEKDQTLSPHYEPGRIRNVVGDWLEGGTPRDEIRGHILGRLPAIHERLAFSEREREDHTVIVVRAINSVIDPDRNGSHNKDDRRFYLSPEEVARRIQSKAESTKKWFQGDLKQHVSRWRDCDYDVDTIRNKAKAETDRYLEDKDDATRRLILEIFPDALETALVASGLSASAATEGVQS